MDIALNEVIHFDAITSDVSGAAVDADSTPTFSVFEEATDTPILADQNFTKRTSLTGNYRGTATLSAANGFEVGKWYNVIGSATVDSVAGKAVIKSFRVVPAENVSGVPIVDVGYVGGEAATTALPGEELADTTIATLATQVSFTLTAGSADDDAYNGCMAVFIDQSTSTQRARCTISDYTGSTKTVTLAAAPEFTIATGDTVKIVAVPKQQGTAALSTVTTAQVNAEVDTALADIHLDHLIASADPTGVVANNSFLAKLVSKSATPSFASYSNQTDSLEALRDRGDAAWVTATGFSTLDAAGVRSAVGLASANLDTQLADLPTVAEFEARTLVAANYFDPAADAVANVTTVANVTNPVALTSAYDFAKGTVAMTEAYAANGAAPTAVQALYAIHQMLMQFAIAGTSVTVKKLDNTTTAFVVTLDDDTDPTGASRT